MKILKSAILSSLSASSSLLSHPCGVDCIILWYGTSKSLCCVPKPVKLTKYCVIYNKQIDGSTTLTSTPRMAENFCIREDGEPEKEQRQNRTRNWMSTSTATGSNRIIKSLCRGHHCRSGIHLKIRRARTWRLASRIRFDSILSDADRWKSFMY